MAPEDTKKLQDEYFKHLHSFNQTQEDATISITDTQNENNSQPLKIDSVNIRFPSMRDVTGAGNIRDEIIVEENNSNSHSSMNSAAFKQATAEPTMLQNSSTISETGDDKVYLQYQMRTLPSSPHRVIDNKALFQQLNIAYTEQSPFNSREPLSSSNIFTDTYLQKREKFETFNDEYY